MNARKYLIGALAISLLAGAPASAQQTPEQAATWRMKKMDTDKDGAVSLEEFSVYRIAWVGDNNQDPKLASPDSIQGTFDRMDSDGDGSVTASEMLEFVKFQRSR